MTFGFPSSVATADVSVFPTARKSSHFTAPVFSEIPNSSALLLGVPEHPPM